MALPKKIKKYIPLTESKTLLPRRRELRDMIEADGTFLPKSLLHADLDRGFLDFVRDELKCVVKHVKRRVASLYLDHDLLRNYKELIRLNKIIKLNLVEIILENGRYLCILHTYKLNIFKRKWRNMHRQA
jgi:hypothetical protein